MKLRTLIITDADKADAIASGDKMFDIVAEDLGVEIGDLIHYNFVCDGNNIRNPVSYRMFIVSYIDRISDCGAAISFKPAMLWNTYVRDLIKLAFADQSNCYFRFYGKDNCEHSQIKFYDSINIIIRNGWGNDIHRNICDIVEMTKLGA